MLPIHLWRINTIPYTHTPHLPGDTHAHRSARLRLRVVLLHSPLPQQGLCGGVEWTNSARETVGVKTTVRCAV